MSLLANPFSRASRAGDVWFCAGATSSYPNVDDSSRVAQQRPCNGKRVPGCRVFHVPRNDSSKATEVAIDDWKDPDAGDSKDQVMVFKYKGKFVAINHVHMLHSPSVVCQQFLIMYKECPHSSYPLSNGTPFDIEDFGVVLSSGITCPQHEWSFDLHTGKSDRGSYRLNVWEVQTRLNEGSAEEADVWVRRKQKMG
jgi:nitrite reductase/ring-hydroxylating ferredoxin subunit